MLGEGLTPQQGVAAERMLSWVESAAIGMDLLAVAIIVIATVMATAAYLVKLMRGAYP